MTPQEELIEAKGLIFEMTNVLETASKNISLLQERVDDDVIVVKRLRAELAVSQADVTKLDGKISETNKRVEKIRIEEAAAINKIFDQQMSFQSDFRDKVNAMADERKVLASQISKEFAQPFSETERIYDLFVMKTKAVLDDHTEALRPFKNTALLVSLSVAFATLSVLGTFLLAIHVWTSDGTLYQIAGTVAQIATKILR